MAPTQVMCKPSSTISSLKLKDTTLYGGGHGRVITISMFPPARPSWSLDDLSTELLALVLTHLRDLDTRSLANVRLLSRRFDAIVTPIKYEYLRLTERILAPGPTLALPYALQNVYRYTHHVEVASDLDPAGIRQLLGGVQRLLSVRWKYVRGEFCRGGMYVPSDILSRHHLDHNKTKLYVDDLPLRDFGSEPEDTYLRAIPTDILTSLKMGNPTPPLTTRLESLKQLLLHSRRLETFHYVDRGQGTRLEFASGERLPAFQELVLQSYDWNHTAQDVAEHWDFSRLRLLKLVDVPIFEFLRSVPFAHLLDLEELHCEDFSAHLPDRRRQATEGLSVLCRQIRALQSLKITCHTEYFPVDALLRHSKSLEILCFRDHVGFGEEYRGCPTVWIEDLVRLSRGLVYLHTLELDMDITMCDPPLFLRALCGFSRLHTLKLHVQTVISTLEDLPPDTDRDYEAAMKTFSTLIRGKQGAPWRSITINVGGWRRHLVRRLDAGWRALNEQGIYAERCFVLERNVDGQMMVREETAIEG
ncbi:hypothetical protein PG989_016087 [Apiospora arundinis]|uniref:F-box domain-containing protein n=1 Tax=Apiospora arundinis TaxID=335852 RepID=A0ABR2JHK5_9PEZI